MCPALRRCSKIISMITGPDEYLTLSDEAVKGDLTAGMQDSVLALFGLWREGHGAASRTTEETLGLLHTPVRVIARRRNDVRHPKRRLPHRWAPGDAAPVRRVCRRRATPRGTHPH